ncbi:MAG TPA: cytochrome b/b6 domain-containing protein [Blastocatellia bacterium]|nr:cytochrome b/b6 domain-containing protein [Blastocatellia bacterium]
MKRLDKKHPLVIRWCHWVNFPLIVVMVWSGILIYLANDVYRLGLGNITLFKFFPEKFYNFLNIGHRLAEGMGWHFTFIWPFLINGLVFVLYTAFSGEWRYLLPSRRSLADAGRVVLHDLHLIKELPSQGKFNGAQRIAYTAVILMGAGSVVTGLAIYKPAQLSWLTKLLGGYQWARFEHFCLTMGYVVFFAIHVAQVVRAGWNNFRAMITGYEVVQVEDANAGRQP